MNNSITLNCSDTHERLTYGQLKKMLPSTEGSILPSCKRIREEKPDVIITADTGTAIITVFRNGFFKYQEADHATVFAVDRCGNMTWFFQNGESSTVDEEVFADCDWKLPLLIAGSHRLEHNRDKLEDDHLDYRFDDYDYDRNAELFSLDDIEKMFAEEESKERRNEELKKLNTASKKLTNRQRQIVRLCYFDGMTHKQIASNIGTSRQFVTHTLGRCMKILKENF